MGTVKFARTASFKAAVMQRIDSSFYETISRRLIYCKAAMFISWAVLSYCVLVFYAGTVTEAVVSAASLALALVGIGFNVQHDGNHQAFSRHRWLNRLAGMTIDVLGGSSYYWKVMHNITHHTYTNINEKDNDVNVAPFARLSPSQPWFRHYKYQHLYLWPLYCLFYLRFTFGDFYKLVSGKVADKKVRPPRGWDLLQFVGGKTLFFSYSLTLPMLWHPWYVVVGFYLAILLCMGLIFAVVFQLAHAVDIVDHPDNVQSRVAEEWEVHQLRTTANFATQNRFLTFVLGGLNLQGPHHLFSRLPHTCYPALAPEIRQVCLEQGIPYHEHPSLFAAIRSHYRFLRMMGRRPN